MLIVTIISLVLNAILFPRVLYLAYVIKTNDERHVAEIKKIKEDRDYYANQAEISAVASYNSLMLLSACTKESRDKNTDKCKNKSNK